MSIDTLTTLIIGFVGLLVLAVVGWAVFVVVHARRQWRAGVRHGTPDYDGSSSEAFSPFAAVGDCSWSDSGGGGGCDGGGGGGGD